MVRVGVTRGFQRISDEKGGHPQVFLGGDWELAQRPPPTKTYKQPTCMTRGSQRKTLRPTWQVREGRQSPDPTFQAP